MRILFILFLIPFTLTAQKNCGDTPELNRKIVKLANTKLKKKVGTGECWDLIQFVLDDTDAEWDKYEVYGKVINHEKKCIYAGDIIQFEGVELEWTEGNMTYTETMGHHVAIVDEVLDDNTLVLIHQNTGQHGRKVGKTTFRLDAMTQGEIVVYRPQEGE